MARVPPGHPERPPPPPVVPPPPPPPPPETRAPARPSRGHGGGGGGPVFPPPAVGGFVPSSGGGGGMHAGVTGSPVSMSPPESPGSRFFGSTTPRPPPPPPGCIWPQPQQASPQTRRHSAAAQMDSSPQAGCVLSSGGGLNLSFLREDTPGLSAGSVRIHLNAAGSSLPPRPVVSCVQKALQEEAEMGGYEFLKQPHRAAELEEVYRLCGRVVGASGSDEIALLDSATTAWSSAFWAWCTSEECVGLMRKVGRSPKTGKFGGRILASHCEYGSNAMQMLQLSRKVSDISGRDVEIVVEFLPSDSYGQVDLAALRRTLEASAGRVRGPGGESGDSDSDYPVILVALTHVPTNSGLVNPAEKVGEVVKSCGQPGLPFFLDACQSVGQLEVNVQLVQCDVLSATGRKYLRAPRGTGFLYVRREFVQRLSPLYVDVKSARWSAQNDFELLPNARRFEQFESNIAARLGLGCALRYLMGVGVDRVARQILESSRQLRVLLENLGPEGVKLTDPGETLCGIVTFSVEPPVEASVLASALWERHRIAVSVSKCQATRVDMEQRGLTEVVRASVHYYNTSSELVGFCAAVQTEMARLKAAVTETA
uniref:Aminotransferase class V domain-containing protein n=1 Tax=Chromera velia CCMP2878 TaxID=1169474 RepID=A0A0G4I228_9ALVE|eukprot:Cvel_10289.t1-p1 / transcript=Cvel_10289.t1 / gene=Cvel_10289 / organism=Chromera_velia_CCMP2878 / gene_product=Probable cysteine desulfurase, putative / transcript_product=Probable cysteine desulfurase, putative / location=Cvel_scaffold618:965-3485(-) / protein_length=596 / sequence_SO=supercontig / SO=protein_coding / is_pseudo=false